MNWLSSPCRAPARAIDCYGDGGEVVNAEGINVNVPAYALTF